MGMAAASPCRANTVTEMNNNDQRRDIIFLRVLLLLLLSLLSLLSSGCAESVGRALMWISCRAISSFSIEEYSVLKQQQTDVGCEILDAGCWMLDAKRCEQRGRGSCATVQLLQVQRLMTLVGLRYVLYNEASAYSNVPGRHDEQRQQQQLSRQGRFDASLFFCCCCCPCMHVTFRKMPALTHTHLHTLTHRAYVYNR